MQTAIADNVSSLVSDAIDQTILEPRLYQTRIISKGYSLYNDGVTSILINSPVGSGKTPMGLLTAKLIQQKYGCGVGWVAMRANLLGQALSCNSETGINVDGLTVISMFDKNPPTRDENGEKIEFLVCDEAHHSVAGSMIHVIDRIRPRWNLGLSGTPFRTDRIKLCYQKTLQDAGIRALVDQGYLSQYHRYVIPDWTPKCVAERYLAEPERWGQSAMYWRTEEDAVACHKLLLDGGCRAGLLLGKMSMTERETTQNMFDQGDLDALVNLYLLTEGWDMPALKTAWVRDSSRGPTIQMGGRVFRKHADHPVKQIVQSANTGYPMDRLVSAAQGHVWCDGSWRTVKANENIEKVHQAVVVALAKASPEMPAFIIKHQEKNRRRRRSQTESGLEQRGTLGSVGWRMLPGRETPGGARSSDSAGMVGGQGHGGGQSPSLRGVHNRDFLDNGVAGQ